MDHRFQINLAGIIDLLSNHLYSGPEVYLRELLQNGIDAIRARRQLDPEHPGQLELEVIGDGATPTLMFADDGVGLDEDEIHRFLATIGETSKRSQLLDQRSEFLGQFGIGLLSCFLVSDEIVVITRSARSGEQPTLEWRGRPDGTYAVKTLERDVAPGTRVYVRAKPGCEDYLRPGRVEALARHYGSLLPIPVELIGGGTRRVLNDVRPPWREAHKSPATLHGALMDYGQQVFETAFFDAVPIHALGGALEGVAYVLPFRPTLAAQGTHRVYLKSMLVSESAKNLVPEWAFFVKCLVDARDLRPNASREALYEDQALEKARAALGRCLRRYLIDMSRKDAEKWRSFLVLHYLSIKALALQDDELYALFIDWLPFETSLGEMTLAEVRERTDSIRFVQTVDQFRQIAQVAAAQSLCVINGGYTYNVELIERYTGLHPDLRVSQIDPSDLAQGFAELGDETDGAAIARFRELADDVLTPFRCCAEVKRFEPDELPTLYTTDGKGAFRRALEQTQEVSSSAWEGVLGDLSQAAAAATSQLCFNFSNPLVRSVIEQQDATLQRRCVQMLYVQALLLGHHPLSSSEMHVLNDGLLGLIRWGLSQR